jgi:hypothetical protein
MDMHRLLAARVADISKAYVDPSVVEESACVFSSVVASPRTDFRPVNTSKVAQLVTLLVTPKHHCFSLTAIFGCA